MWILHLVAPPSMKEESERAVIRPNRSGVRLVRPLRRTRATLLGLQKFDAGGGEGEDGFEQDWGSRQIIR
jgi:hypothetical protein